jgi:hypothetical protein
VDPERYKAAAMANMTFPTSVLRESSPSKTAHSSSYFPPRSFLTMTFVKNLTLAAVFAAAVVSTVSAASYTTQPPAYTTAPKGYTTPPPDYTTAPQAYTTPPQDYTTKPPAYITPPAGYTTVYGGDGACRKPYQPGELCAGAPGKLCVPWCGSADSYSTQYECVRPAGYEGYGTTCAKVEEGKVYQVGERCLGAPNKPYVLYYPCVEGPSCTDQDEEYGLKRAHLHPRSQLRCTSEA